MVSLARQPHCNPRLLTDTKLAPHRALLLASMVIFCLKMVILVRPQWVEDSQTTSDHASPVRVGLRASRCRMGGESAPCTLPGIRTGYKEHGTRQGTSVWYKVQDTRQGTKCKAQKARYKVQSTMGGVDSAPSAAPT